MVADPETCRLNGAKSKGAITERGKEISSRNATKHGLLAQKPPILASEDLETFQEIVQGLVDQYQPDNPLEWHLVQTIAVCIQRHHRVWAAEAAVGNTALLTPVQKPYTNEKYPAYKTPDFKLCWTEFHPENLQLEHKLLSDFLGRYKSEDFPTGLLSKYGADTWQEWCQPLKNLLTILRDDYPVDHFRLQDSQGFRNWLIASKEQNHPFGKVSFYLIYIDEANCPKSKMEVEYTRSQYVDLLESFKARLQKIDAIELEIQREEARYQRELEEQRLAIINPLSEQLALISRYESHIAKQMNEAIAQLQKLQSERKNKGSMGSFRQNP